MLWRRLLRNKLDWTQPVPMHNFCVARFFLNFLNVLDWSEKFAKEENS